MALGQPNFERAALRSSSADRSSWLATGLLVFAFVAWCTLASAARALPESVNIQVLQIARALSTGLFLTAGVLWLARWRLTNDSQSACAAAALILLGGALPIVGIVGPFLQTPPQLSYAMPAGRLLLLLPVLGLVTASARTSRRDLRPLPLVVVLFAAWGIVTAGLAELHSVSTVLPMDVPQVWLLAECFAAATWVVLASVSWRQGHREARPTLNWMAVALALMGLCELLKAGSIALPGGPFAIGPGVQFLAAGVAAIAAGAELREAYRIDDGRSVVLAQALVDTQEQLAQVQQTYRERLHDARSAVIGVVGASRLLSQPSAPAAPDPRRLHEMMAAELGRLQETLDTDRVEPIGEFRLTDVLEPLVLSHRLAGGVVDVEMDSVVAVGRPTATATALANLLANARAHAPGARVTVHAAQHGPTVIMIVDDDGAGIPAGERERVLLRGARGSTSRAPGSGLGLYTAATAMADQSGTLHLAERPGGGTRAILTIPAAAYPRLAEVDATRAQAC